MYYYIFATVKDCCVCVTLTRRVAHPDGDKAVNYFVLLFCSRCVYKRMFLFSMSNYVPTTQSQKIGKMFWVNFRDPELRSIFLVLSVDWYFGHPATFVHRSRHISLFQFVYYFLGRLKLFLFTCTRPRDIEKRSSGPTCCDTGIQFVPIVRTTVFYIIRLNSDLVLWVACERKRGNRANMSPVPNSSCSSDEVL